MGSDSIYLARRFERRQRFANKWSLTPFNLAPFNLGASFLEFVVVVLVVAVVSLFLAERLFYYQERAEQIQMRLAVRLLDAAARLHMAELLIAGDAQAIERLRQANPFDWLSPQLPNYAGPRSAQQLQSGEEIVEGQWYFDTTRREAVYAVATGGHLIAANGARQIRYRVQVVATGRKLEGVRITPVDAYQWFDDGSCTARSCK